MCICSVFTYQRAKKEVRIQTTLSDKFIPINPTWGVETQQTTTQQKCWGPIPVVQSSNSLRTSRSQCPTSNKDRQQAVTKIFYHLLLNHLRRTSHRRHTTRKNRKFVARGRAQHKEDLLLFLWLSLTNCFPHRRNSATFSDTPRKNYAIEVSEYSKARKRIQRP